MAHLLSGMLCTSASFLTFKLSYAFADTSRNIMSAGYFFGRVQIPSPVNNPSNFRLLVQVYLVMYCGELRRRKYYQHNAKVWSYFQSTSFHTSLLFAVRCYLVNSPRTLLMFFYFSPIRSHQNEFDGKYGSSLMFPTLLLNVFLVISGESG